MGENDEIILAKPYAADEWARLIRQTDWRIELYRYAFLEYTQRCANRREANQLAQAWLNKREITLPE